MFDFRFREKTQEERDRTAIIEALTRGTVAYECSILFEIYKSLYYQGIMPEEDFVKSTQELILNMGYIEN
jgi:hypothetical protein